MAVSQPLSEMPGVAGAVYQVGAKVIVKDFSSKIRSKRVYQGILGTNDVAALQYAQNNIVGTVYVGPGTYYWGALETLLIKNKTICAGIDKTIFKMANGVNSSCRTLVEMDNAASIFDVTLDGNIANNDGGWTSFANVPFAQGLYMSRRLSNSDVILLSTDTYASNIKIKDTIRSNVVMTGYRNAVSNVYLENSLWDHAIYYSGAYDCQARDIDICGYYRNEVVPMGTDAVDGMAYRNVLENVLFRDFVVNPNAANKVGEVICLRPGVGYGKENVLRNLRFNISGMGSDTPCIIESNQPGTLIDGVHGRFADVNINNYSSLIYLSGPVDSTSANYQIVRNVDMDVVTATNTSYSYFIYAKDVAYLTIYNVSGRVMDANTKWRGIYLIPTNVAMVASVRGALYDTPSYPLLGYATSQPLSIVDEEVGWFRTPSFVTTCRNGTKQLHNYDTVVGTGVEQTIPHYLLAAPTIAGIYIPTTGELRGVPSDATNLKATVDAGVTFIWRAKV